MIWDENGLGVCMILWLILLWIETIGREEVGGTGIMRIKLSEYQRCFYFLFFLGRDPNGIMMFYQGRCNGE